MVSKLNVILIIKRQRLCSVSDDQSALIWDLNQLNEEINGIYIYIFLFTTLYLEPFLQFKTEEEITNVAWS